MLCAMKILLIGALLLAVLGLVGLLMIGGESDEPQKLGSDPFPRHPAFEVEVVKPRSARPLLGILPKSLEDSLVEGGELRFDQTSLGAHAGWVGERRLELGAEGWQIHLEIGAEGEIASASYLRFPMIFAGKLRRVLCRPEAEPRGFLRTDPSQAGELDGSFVVKLVDCYNDESGKKMNWPPAALTARGRFEALPEISG
jgi:hypothetical protein